MLNKFVDRSEHGDDVLCVRACACACVPCEYTGATGCEVIWDRPNRGCYVMTQPVARGNFVARHSCWVFSKCAGMFWGVFPA